MSLTSAEVRISFAALSDGPNAVTPQRFDPTVASLLAFASGTTADKADRLYVAPITLAASASIDLDLAGSLADAFGTTLTFVELVAIGVFADDANTNSIEVGGAASNAVPIFKATNDVAVVRPGGFLAIAAPDAAGLCTVTAGTGDILKLANSGGTTGVTGKIFILGRSA